jgi:hypothetical protein
MSVRVEVEAHGGPSSHRTESRSRSPGDDAEQIISGVSAYQKAGVEHVVFALNTGDIPRIRGLMENIAGKVMPRFR